MGMMFPFPRRRLKRAGRALGGHSPSPRAAASQGSASGVAGPDARAQKASPGGVSPLVPYASGSSCGGIVTRPFPRMGCLPFSLLKIKQAGLLFVHVNIEQILIEVSIPDSVVVEEIRLLKKHLNNHKTKRSALNEQGPLACNASGAL